MFASETKCVQIYSLHHFWNLETKTKVELQKPMSKLQFLWNIILNAPPFFKGWIRKSEKLKWKKIVANKLNVKKIKFF